MGVLEALTFDNLALRALPVDAEEGSRIRQVRRACYSRVKPTPVEHPRLVAASPSALALLDLDASEVITSRALPFSLQCLQPCSVSAIIRPSDIAPMSKLSGQC